jgi:hypothetical protein
VVHRSFSAHLVKAATALKLDRDVHSTDGFRQLAVHNTDDASMPEQQVTSPHLPQHHGPGEHYSGQQHRTFPSRPQAQNHPPRSRVQSATRPQGAVSPNAAIDLLRWCTADMPLNNEQVIVLSDVAGSLKELMVLALTAKVDEGASEQLIRAVGEDATAGTLFATQDLVPQL